MSTKQPRPAKLGPGGRKLWDSITSVYELRGDELRILTDACREADIVDKLTEALGNSELYMEGSREQLVLTPLLSEVRQHRVVLRQNLSALKLPAEDAGTAAVNETTSDKARRAANTRWTKERGKAAS